MLAALAAALWGLAPVATKAALRGYSPEFISVFRLTVAALAFRLFAGSGAQFFVSDVWVWLAGAALGTDFILYNYGLQRTAANVAGLVINVELVSTIAFAMWLLGERLNVRRVLGSAVTLSGVLLVSLEGLNWEELTSGERTAGNLLVMAAGVSWSLFAVAQHRARRRRTLFHRLTPIFSVAALTCVPPALSPDAWRIPGGVEPTIMLVVLTIFCTGVVYFVYARAQQLIDVSVLAILVSSIPIFALVFAYALLGEPLTPHLVIGGAIVIAGVVIIAAEKTVAPEPSPALVAASMKT